MSNGKDMIIHLIAGLIKKTCQIDDAKKTEYNKLVTKVYNIDTTNFVKKTNMKKMGQILKIKSTKKTKKCLMLLVWLKKQNLILKLLKQKEKYLMLVV